MTPESLFADGRLREALAAQKNHVHQHPDDEAARLFLSRLHLYVGELDEAGRLLKSLRVDTDEMREFVAAGLDLIAAERTRQTGEEPALLVETDSTRLRMKAWHALNRGSGDECFELLDTAVEAAPEIAGHLDGREFEAVRNTDELLSGVLEVFVGPDYVWVPFEAVRKLRLAEIDTPADHLFRPGLLTLTDGRSVEVLLPTVYAGTWRHPDDAFLLGQDTDWVADPNGLTRGVGAQLLWFGDEELTLRDFRIMEVR